MSNIHRLGDFSTNNNRMPGGRMGMSLPLLANVGSSGDPRRENIFQMCKYTCCPSLKISNFIAIITIIDILVFIIVLAIGGTPKGSLLFPVDFLAPNSETLWKFGEKDPYAMIHSFQIWRFITPVFLHASLAHLLTNSFSQLIFGSMIESIIGRNLTAIIYFVCAIGGNLFSALVSDTPSVGASTAISGLLGIYIGYLIISWQALDYEGSPRMQMLCFVVIIIFLNVFTGTGPADKTSHIDHYGHLGGLLAGVFVSMATIKAINNRNEDYEKKVRKYGQILTVVYFVLGFILFFAARKPEKRNPYHF